MTEIFGGLMMLGMVVGIGVGGYKANKEIPALKKQANQINQEAKTLEQKYNLVIKDAEKHIEEFTTAITTNLNNISKLNAQIYESKQNFDVQYRTIQIVGALFIVSLFLTLVFKEIYKLFLKKKPAG
jgi:biotin-(acetyl-CoA carboxylase) ligase